MRSWRWPSYGAFVEHILIRYDDRSHEAQPIDRLVGWIRRVGAERTVISSDLGQRTSPLPGDSFRRVVGQLLERGVSEAELRLMLRTNPARLVGARAHDRIRAAGRDRSAGRSTARS